MNEHVGGRAEAGVTASDARQNAGGCGIAAALLLYFGFMYFATPEGDDLFAWGGKVFVTTLRAGGIAMAVVVALCLTGWVGGLAVDALVSIAIGLGLCVGAALMMLGGGGSLDGLLGLVFGVMLVLAGIRNGQAWAATTQHKHVHFERPR